ncbi:MAG: hypothetical protein BJ554DRAFT_7558, partial [Olpidium bornovanus]
GPEGAQLRLEARAVCQELLLGYACFSLLPIALNGMCAVGALASRKGRLTDEFTARVLCSVGTGESSGHSRFAGQGIPGTRSSATTSVHMLVTPLAGKRTPNIFQNFSDKDLSAWNAIYPAGLGIHPGLNAPEGVRVNPPVPVPPAGQYVRVLPPVPADAGGM